VIGKAISLVAILAAGSTMAADMSADLGPDYDYVDAQGFRHWNHTKGLTAKADEPVRLPYLAYPEDHVTVCYGNGRRKKCHRVDTVKDQQKFVPLPDKEEPATARAPANPVVPEVAVKPLPSKPQLRSVVADSPPVKSDPIVPKVVRVIPLATQSSAPPSWAGALTIKRPQ
jgi:hypothetical protein